MMKNALKKRLKTLRALCTDAQYRELKRSRLFDPRFYLKRNPHIASLPLDPLLYYLQTGWQEARPPSLVFDTLHYLRAYPDVCEEKIDPLRHYLRKGWRQGKNPNPYFDTVFYLQRYRAEIPADREPLAYYLCVGWKRGHYPAPVFEDGRLHREFARLQRLGGNPLLDFLSQIEELRNTPDEVFDERWYYDRTPSIAGSRQDLWHHYIDFGIFEGKSPLPLFDPEYYRRHNDDVDDYVREPYAHFRSREKKDHRRPSAWFDPASVS